MATPIPKNRIARTSEAIARAAGGTLVRGDGARAHTGITTDSREVAAGSMFVALRGENFDGHAFVADAARAGATLLVVERARAAETAEIPEVDLVAVDDTLVAWGAIAKDHVQQWRAQGTNDGARRIVAITGSAGKTTTKSLLAALLGEIGPTHATLGNLNNRIGVPATLFGIEPHHRFVALEVGTSVPGEIAALGAISAPDAAILTNVGIAHAEHLGGTRAHVGREKGALFEALPEDGCAVVNADDDEALRQAARARTRRVVYFGRAPSAGYRLLERSHASERGARIVFARPEGSPVTLAFPLAGEAAAIDFLAALAAAEFAAGRTLDESTLALALQHLAPVAGRAQIHQLPTGTTLIDDSYNANPSSMIAALDLAAELARPQKRRIVAVLGEMRELGAASYEAHAELGEHLARVQVDLAIGCGGAIDLTLARASQSGVPVLAGASTDEAIALARARVEVGDVVLVKGSRGVRTERVVAALLAGGRAEKAEKKAP